MRILKFRHFQFQVKNIGSQKENEETGFVVFSQQLLILRLGQVSVNDCPSGLENWPCRGQKQEKSYCENTTNPLLLSMIKNIFYRLLFNSKSPLNNYENKFRDTSFFTGAIERLLIALEDFFHNVFQFEDIFLSQCI